MNRQVFINCPFSDDYQDCFHALCFTIIRSGYQPRCARETDDGSENRFDKICGIISVCRLGIHDISKTEPDSSSGLPRFNMPFELGLFLGAKKFGPAEQKEKKCIIFDREPHRYQKFLSDISGQDIHHHDGKPDLLIRELASWLRNETADKKVPGGKAIASDFRRFQGDIPAVCATRHLDPAELNFQDFVWLAAQWIRTDSAAKP